MRRIVIGVMGPGDNATAADCNHAFALGQQIAQQGWVLLTGGRNVGVMEAANRGAHAANGLTIGVLPTADTTHLSADVDLPILTDMGNARNAINVLTSHVVIACGMGAGTASEVALAIKLKKPVILLGGSAHSRSFFQELGGGQVQVVATAEEAIAIVQKLLS